MMTSEVSRDKHHLRSDKILPDIIQIMCYCQWSTPLSPPVPTQNKYIMCIISIPLFKKKKKRGTLQCTCMHLTLFLYWIFLFLWSTWGVSRMARKSISIWCNVVDPDRAPFLIYRCENDNPGDASDAELMGQPKTYEHVYGSGPWMGVVSSGSKQSWDFFDGLTITLG